uniref:F-box domain-containing protein n=1 Tax=Setaria italica TaxID=4555 RepID=K4A366_SETIT
MATWGSHGGVDRISSLPDHLLHTILLHLSDAEAAARTTILSRRWRRVWAHLPELSFRYHRDAGARTWAHRRVDAALAAYPGPTVTLLDIDLPLWAPAPREHPVDPDRDDPLLRFLASQRVAGELRLLLRDRGWGDVVLPPCERVTAISLSVIALTLRFQPLPDGGTFAALAILRITSARVDSRELGDVLSSRCPRLKELYLKRVGLMKDRDRVLSIRSNSLERLEMDMKVYHGARLQVIAPKLRVFVSPRIFSDAPIVAPMLLEMCWDGPYDPSRRHLGEAGRHLQRLDIAKNTTPAATMLMRQFYAVHELQLTVQIWKIRYLIYEILLVFHLNHPTSYL